jgi:hypothetical protein
MNKRRAFAVALFVMCSVAGVAPEARADTFIYNTGDGNDVIMNATTSDRLIYDGRTVTGGSRTSTDPANTYRSSDGQFTFERSSDLVIYRGTASNGSVTARPFRNGVLGITLVDPPPDTTAPSVLINQTACQPDPTSTSPINFTAIFNEPVIGFTGSDVTINGTAGGTKTVAVTGGPSVFTVAVSGMTSSGTVIATIPAGRATDAAGNGNTASTSTDNTVTFAPADTTAPTVTINQAAGQADPTSTTPITFTAVFSEPVSGFTGSDVTINGTAGGTKTVTVTGGPSTYSVAVSGLTSSGTVIATIPAGGATDTAGNGNTASTSSDNTVTFATETLVTPL